MDPADRIKEGDRPPPGARASSVADGPTAGPHCARGRPDPRRRAVGGGPVVTATPARGGRASACARPALRRDRGADGNERRERPSERLPGHEEVTGDDEMNTSDLKRLAAGAADRSRDAAAALPDRAAADGLLDVAVGTV